MRKEVAIILLVLMILPYVYSEAPLKIDDIRFNDVVVAKDNKFFVLYENNLDYNIDVKFVGEITNKDIVKTIETNYENAEANSKKILVFKINDFAKEGDYVLNGHLETNKVNSNEFSKEVKVLKPSTYFIKVKLAYNPFLIILLLLVMVFLSIKLRRSLDENR